MITYLDGCLAELLPGRLTIDVGGLGYEVLVPLSTSDTMPPIGKEATCTTGLRKIAGISSKPVADEMQKVQ